MKNNRGQTSLILILLSAAALIFLAISLNWGRIAAAKSLVTIAADQSAALLASNVASYGEMEKVSNLDDSNETSGLATWVLDLIAVVVAVVVLIITILSYGTLAPLGLYVIAVVFAAIAVAAAVVTLGLQLAVIQPGMNQLWNKLQADQPIKQQLYEEGVASALQGSITDQVTIQDYLDSNANGLIANGSGVKDNVSRFGLFYTDRLKMLNRQDIIQVDHFYNQLQEFTSGETCLQNYTDTSTSNNGISLNPSCIDPLTGLDYCFNNNQNSDPACTAPIPATVTCSQNVYEYNNLSPSCKTSPSTQGCIQLDPACTACEAKSTDPSCQTLVSNQFSFQLSDPCSGSDPGNQNTYNPYCDPCCQPMVVNGKSVRPTSCAPYTDGYPPDCFAKPKSSECDPNLYPDLLSEYRNGPGQCSIYSNGLQDNPTGSLYPLIYDKAYQDNYAGGSSFLEQFGRDQQMAPPTPMAPEPQGVVNANAEPAGGYFPTGVYPLFWLMQQYSPEVDNINDAALQTAQAHWCAGTMPAGYVPPSPTTVVLFPELGQLALDYTCQGQDCCVNFLPDLVDPTSTVPAPDPTFPKGTPNGPIDLVGSLGVSRSNTLNLSDCPLLGECCSLNPTSGACQAASCKISALPLRGTCANNPTGTCAGTNCWISADNQMCSVNDKWPYNGNTPAFPDGTCEWTNTTNAPGSNTPGPNATVDNLDDVMHTMSDFASFAQDLLTQDPGTLSATLDSWYPKAAEWIAPACSSSCTSAQFDDPNSNCDSDPACLQSSKDGRLLQIYDPGNFPNIPGTSNTGARKKIDKFNQWNILVSNWLANVYTPQGSTSATVWCVPSETIASGLQVSENGNIVNTTEDKYIRANAGTSKWGDLPHVLACVNYNAGPDQTLVNASPYQTCLTQLTSGTCPTTLPAACSQTSLGYPSTVTPPSYASTNPHRCEPYYINPAANGLPSFANWVSGQINYGPAYNYQNCLDLLKNICPASLDGTVCDPAILGRSLTPAFTGTTYSGGKVGDAGCDPTINKSYAQWVQTNEELFNHEEAKFQLRGQYLSDIYNRAQVMKSITAQADYAIHAFMKPCGTTQTCKNGASCSAGGCADGSTCGLYCMDGGPAAQLIYARHSSQKDLPLPNSVVYGWVDKSLPNGKTLPGRTGGYAHVVRVTAYSAGRQGSNTGLKGVQDSLPEIHSWTAGFKQKYALKQRDGNVYVSIQRWDENQNTPVSFPNKHALWTFTFNNPNRAINSSLSNGNPLSACISNYPNSGLVPSLTQPIGIGFMPDTIKGFIFHNQITPKDLNALANAFMLNDNGNGDVDHNAVNDTSSYNRCLQFVNTVLPAGTESHACVRYVASLNGHSSSSDNGDNDYRMYFMDCNNIDDGSPPQSTP